MDLSPEDSRPPWWAELVRFGAVLAVVGALVVAGALIVPRLFPGSTELPAPATGAPPTSGSPSAPGSASPSGPPAAGPAATPSASPSAAGPASPSAAGPAPSTSASPAPPGASPGGRPADAYAGWAAELAPRLDIPAVALQAYGYAETVVTATDPDCRLSWTILAGIGRIESNHGRFNDAVLAPDGTSRPPVVGIPLDGRPGVMTIRDTDGGRLDGDTVYDRAVGPLQFIPTTWDRWGTDADANGRVDPYDIDDAALASATYLCADGRDLTTAAGWSGAVLSYNRTQVYLRDVYAAADDYGRRSL